MKETNRGMGNDDTSREDAELSSLLQSWRVQASDDPALVARVRQQIENESSSSLRAWLDRLVAVLGQPIGAATAVSVCIMAGVIAAQTQIDNQQNDRLTRLAKEYVRSIDPVLMTSPEEGSHQR